MYLHSLSTAAAELYQPPGDSVDSPCARHQATSILRVEVMGSARPFSTLELGGRVDEKTVQHYQSDRQRGQGGGGRVNDVDERAAECDLGDACKRPDGAHAIGTALGCSPRTVLIDGVDAFLELPIMAAVINLEKEDIHGEHCTNRRAGSCEELVPCALRGRGRPLLSGDNENACFSSSKLQVE